MTGLGLQKSRTKAEEEQKNILTASVRYLSDIFQGNNFPPPFSEGEGPRGPDAACVSQDPSEDHRWNKLFLAQQPFTQYTIAPPVPFRSLC